MRLSEQNSAIKGGDEGGGLLSEETYLVERKGDHFAARQTNGELLRMPIVQRTIQEVLALDCTQTFKENDPDNANRLGP